MKLELRRARLPCARWIESPQRCSTRLGPSALVGAAMLVSLVFLALAVRTIPVSTGYAVWTGIGALGTATLGVLVLGEPITAQRVLFLALILAGVLGLKFWV